MSLVAAEGVEAATNARIAGAAGITAAALYRHFDNRDQVLLAALDLLHDRIRELAPDPTEEPNALERLRGIARANANLIASNQGDIAYAIVEFLAAPPSTGLREIVGAKHLETIQSSAAKVEEGKAQGVIRSDVDSEQVAWEIFAIMSAENTAYMMGLGQFVTAGRSTTMLNGILERIANRPEDSIGSGEVDQIRRLLKLCPALKQEATSS